MSGTEFAWGTELVPDGRHMANTWQGQFPWQNLEEDGFVRMSPVGTCPANGYGLVDMIGNVWEWTQDWFSNRHPTEVARPRCVPRNPQGALLEARVDPSQAGVGRKVLKGGSLLGVRFSGAGSVRRVRPKAVKTFSHRFLVDAWEVVAQVQQGIQGGPTAS